MGRKLIITEKPSVARDFARVLGVTGKHQGYLENQEYVITWCVGHLVEMVYPEKYDIKYKTWRLEDLPFLPDTYKYDVIQNVKDQYNTVNGFLNSPEIDVVYWAGDSGKEGQTIEENIRNYGGVRDGIKELRVWIDSQTDDEIKRGIAEAKPMSDYANLGKSGIMRAIEDYALGINFSRALSVKYARMVNNAAATKKYTAIAVGRVMTCVLGMVVDREREIRDFTETPFYRIIGQFTNDNIKAEWNSDKKSVYYKSPLLYKENGFKAEADANKLIEMLNGKSALVEKIEKVKSKKKAPALFNLAELQAECSKRFKISPDETLSVAQVLYERKLCTYPRSDARVLTTAVAKEINKNLNGLKGYAPVSDYINHINENKLYIDIEKTQYTDDSKVTDHYAIIPTGQTGTINGLNDIQKKVYDLIVRRFLSIFYPPAEYLQLKMNIRVDTELFVATEKLLTDKGYLEVAGIKKDSEEGENSSSNIDVLLKLKKGDVVSVESYEIKQGKTTPPKRYTSGTMILAMENAGNLIEDEELRAQIKNTGIGTSATRAEIIKKLITIGYLNLNNKTQVLTPSIIGEMIYEVVNITTPSLLNPKMSASWEKGLDEITNGNLLVEDYRNKLESYIRNETLDIANNDKSDDLANRIGKMLPQEGDIIMPKRKIGIKCPACGGDLSTTPFGYGCDNYNNKDKPCRFCIGKIAGYKLSVDELNDLIVKGKTKNISGFKSKAGKPFSASLLLKKEKDGLPQIVFDFVNSNTADIKTLRCPICGGSIVSTENGFACSTHSSNNGCIFSIGLIKGKKLSEKDISDLILNGITNTINGFKDENGNSLNGRIALSKGPDGNVTGLRFIADK